jgi:hypothetical protein
MEPAVNIEVTNQGKILITRQNPRTRKLETILEERDKEKLQETTKDIEYCIKHIERTSNHLREIFKKRKIIEEKLMENEEFKEVDLFYRPVFDYTRPFNPAVYEHEHQRLQMRKKQVAKLISEIDEDEMRLEYYRERTSRSITQQRKQDNEPRSRRN